VKLRGRTTTSERRRGRTISPATRGAKQTTHHGPLHRLLGGSGITELNYCTRRAELGVKRGLPWIPLVAQQANQRLRKYAVDKLDRSDLGGPGKTIRYLKVDGLPWARDAVNYTPGEYDLTPCGEAKYLANLESCAHADA